MKELAKTNENKLIYLRIASDIRDSIKNGVLKSGTNIIPERKLAESYHVSYGTVRKAIQSLVEEKLLTKIQGSGIFVADKPKTTSNPHKRIGINVPTLNLSYYADMVMTMEQIITDKQCEFILIRSDLGRNSENNRLESILQRTKLDGLLVAGEISCERFQNIKKIAPDMQIIFLDGGVAGEEVDSIKFDDESGAFAATEHLIRQGREKILFIDGGNKYINSRLRERGYLAAIRRYNIEPCIKYGQGFDYESGYNAMQEVISERNIPDAIFCVTDLVAMGAMQVLDNHLITIPNQVLIVGFSNLREADFTRPRISSVKVDFKEISRLAVTEMFDKIEGRSRSRWQVIFPTHLIVRESSNLDMQKRNIMNSKNISKNNKSTLS